MNHESESNEPLDLREHGAPVDGTPQVSDRRLYAQVHVYTGVTNMDEVTATLGNTLIDTVLYADVNDPYGIGLLFLSDDPEVFVTTTRDLLNQSPFDMMDRRAEMNMFGRTYATGYEPDLEDALIGRPCRTALNPEWPWAILYPLRRSVKSSWNTPLSGEPTAVMTTPTTYGSPVTEWTKRTTTSSSAWSVRTFTPFPVSSRT